jgi:hypothetical protein
MVDIRSESGSSDHDDPIEAAKSEGVGHGRADLACSWGADDVIGHAIVGGLGESDRGRHLSLMDGEGSDGRFDGTCGP